MKRTGTVILLTAVTAFVIGSVATSATGWTVVATGSSSGGGFVNAQASATVSPNQAPFGVVVSKTGQVNWFLSCNGTANGVPGTVVPVSEAKATSCDFNASSFLDNGGSVRVQLVRGGP